MIECQKKKSSQSEERRYLREPIIPKSKHKQTAGDTRKLQCSSRDWFYSSFEYVSLRRWQGVTAFRQQSNRLTSRSVKKLYKSHFQKLGLLHQGLEKEHAPPRCELFRLITERKSLLTLSYKLLWGKIKSSISKIQ